MKEFWQEVAMMTCFRDHPNVAQIIGYSDQPPMILLRAYPHGTLDMLLRVGVAPSGAAGSSGSSGSSPGSTTTTTGTTTGINPLPLILKRKLCVDVARGLYHLHTRRFAHGHLKPANIWIALQRDPDVEVKVAAAVVVTSGKTTDANKTTTTIPLRLTAVLGELGGATLLTGLSIPTREVGQAMVRYAAPDAIKAGRDGDRRNPALHKSADMYQLGSTIHEILADGTPPWTAVAVAVAQQSTLSSSSSGPTTKH